MEKETARQQIIRYLKNNKKWNPAVVLGILQSTSETEKAIENLDNEGVILAAAMMCGTTVAKMKAFSREEEAVMARDLCFEEFKKRGYSHNECVRLFNETASHTAVTHALQRLRRDLEADNNGIVSIRRDLLRKLGRT